MLKIEKKLIWYGNDTCFEIKKDDFIKIKLKNAMSIDAELKGIDETFFTVKDYDSGRSLLLNYDEVAYIELEQFHFENFKKELFEWHDAIKKELLTNKYDMTLLCIDTVLDTVEDIIQNHTTFK